MCPLLCKGVLSHTSQTYCILILNVVLFYILILPLCCTLIHFLSIMLMLFRFAAIVGLLNYGLYRQADITKCAQLNVNGRIHECVTDSYQC